jgi:hypothetical protein
MRRRRTAYRTGRVLADRDRGWAASLCQRSALRRTTEEPFVGERSRAAGFSGFAQLFATPRGGGRTPCGPDAGLPVPEDLRLTRRVPNGLGDGSLISHTRGGSHSPWVEALPSPKSGAKRAERVLTGAHAHAGARGERLRPGARPASVLRGTRDGLPPPTLGTSAAEGKPELRTLRRIPRLLHRLEPACERGCGTMATSPSGLWPAPRLSWKGCPA